MNVLWVDWIWEIMICVCLEVNFYYKSATWNFTGSVGNLGLKS